jgi:hypothetical protein
MGADQKTIQALVENLLEAPPVPTDHSPALADTPDSSPARQTRPKCSSQGKESSSKRRPPARGVLGFRIRTADKKQYAVVNEPPGTPFTTTPPETTSHQKRRRVQKRKTGDIPEHEQ